MRFRLASLRNCISRPLVIWVASASRERRILSSTSAEPARLRSQILSNSVKTFSSLEW